MRRKSAVTQLWMLQKSLLEVLVNVQLQVKISRGYSLTRG